MCSEFQLVRERAEDLIRQFALTRSLFTAFRPDTYFPKHPIPAVGRGADGARGLVGVRWGLLPNWYPDPGHQPQPFNARAETVAKSSLFREAFAARRCIIPAEAFFEWTRTRPKVRYRLAADGSLLAIAGLWDVWRGGDGPPVASAAMVTTAANDLIGAFHDRMPVLLEPKDYDEWLDPDTPPAALLPLLKPFPAERMTCAAEPRRAPAVV